MIKTLLVPLDRCLQIRYRSRPLVLSPFSVTLVPCPLVCLASLLVARVLHDKAFIVEFESLQAILDQLKMGDVDYIPLDWKEGFDKKPIIPIAYFKFKELWDQTLLAPGFRQSEQPYSMRVGAGARLNGMFLLNSSRLCYIIIFI